MAAAALRLGLAALLASMPASDPGSLVSKLGSGRFAQREEASRDLERLGRDALPALKTARTSRDPEVRVRALGLVERIESGLMVRPTLVKLDFRDVPLNEAARMISDRGHMGLHIADGAAASEPITALRDEPVPFWTAVETLAGAGRLQIGAAAMGGMMPHPAGKPARPDVTLVALPPNARPAPSSVSGPFRIAMTQIQHNRERLFGSQGNPGMGGMGLPPREFGGMARGGMTNGDQFTVGLTIQPEPRISAALAGPIRLTEASDDRGRSLLPSANGANFQQSSGYRGFDGFAGTALPAQVTLKYPESAPKAIRTLRGMIPLSISARKDEPVVISLADGRGKMFRSAETSLTLHDSGPDPQFPGQWTVELTLRSLDPAGSAAEGGFPAEFLAIRNLGSPQGQLEILDDRGRVLSNWHSSSQMQGPEGLRLTLRVLTSEGTGLPAQIRFYEMARASLDAEFSFSDVPMP